MATDRIHRNARRGIAVAVLGWLSVAAAAVVLAPSASAAPAVTVPIRDLTPPVVSVDGGGTVTFVNEIQDKTVQVGGGGLLPTLVSVTAKTEVTLGLPSGQRVLAPGASVTETFDRTWAEVKELILGAWWRDLQMEKQEQEQTDGQAQTP